MPDPDSFTTRLSNGLQIVLTQRQHTRTTAICIFSRAGSRYDMPHPGKSHLLEHLLFKCNQRLSSFDIYSQIESIGGEINAATTREYMVFHSVTMSNKNQIGLDLLNQLICHANIPDETSFFGEKIIVSQEMVQAREQTTALGDLFMQTLWEPHPMSSPILGTLDGLQNLTQDIVWEYFLQRFSGTNLLVSVCGDIQIDPALKSLENLFGCLPAGDELPAQSPPPLMLNEPRVKILKKDTGLTQMMMGIATPGMAHPDRSSLKIIELLLGMGGSGRLYQRIREELKLAYHINTIFTTYEDAGTIIVQASCEPEAQHKMQQAILKEWQTLKEQKVHPDDLERAKGNYAGTLARRFETNLAVANISGIEGLLHEVESFNDAIERIQAVTADQVLSAAQKYLDTSRYATAVIGPLVDPIV